MEPVHHRHVQRVQEQLKRTLTVDIVPEPKMKDGGLRAMKVLEVSNIWLFALFPIEGILFSR